MVGYVALFVALSGAAYAVQKIGPSQIKKNAVRAKHIKDNEVKGAEVDEATLAKVPQAASADTAASAATAASASSAANANQLGGLGADQFLRADAIEVKGPTVINDPPGGSPTTAPFLTVGQVSITASCEDTGAGRQAGLVGTAPSASPGSGARVGVNGGLMGDFDAPLYGGAPQTIVLSGSVTTSDGVRPGVLTVFDPAAGVSWTGDFWLSVNMGGDCAFGLVGMSSP